LKNRPTHSSASVGSALARAGSLAILAAYSSCLGAPASAAQSLCTFAPDVLRGVPPITRGTSGVFFDINTDFQEPAPLNKETASLFRWLSESLKAKGTSLVVVLSPTRGIAFREYLEPTDPAQRVYVPADAQAGYGTLIQQMRELGLRVADLAPLVEDPKEPPFLRRNPFLTSEGAKKAAQITAEILINDESYQNLPKTEVAPQPVSNNQAQSPMSAEIRRACREPFSDEAQPRFVFEPIIKSRIVQDPQTAPVTVMVAGSETVAEAVSDFAGFLSQYTQLSVRNVSSEAYNSFASLLRLVSSADFQAVPPRFLVWELPAHTSINSLALSAFREIIPAVDGLCKVSSALMDKPSIVPHNGTLTLSLADLGGKPLDLSSAYISLTSEKDLSPTADVVVQYTSGELDIFRIGSAEPQSTGAPIFGWFSHEIPSTVEAISVHNLAGTSTRSIRICPLSWPRETGS
jgi:alginate biosynthesis protein AlgX